MKVFFLFYSVLKSCFSFFLSGFEKKIVEILKKENLKISTAESCTSGLVASRITDVKGSSEILQASFVVYSNEAKEKLLNIKRETIKKYTEVSENCAIEMADGLMEKGFCNIAVSLTGFLGPDASSKKLLGSVFLCIKDREHQIVCKLQLQSVKLYAENDFLNFIVRKVAKIETSNLALTQLYDFLKNIYSNIDNKRC